MNAAVPEHASALPLRPATAPKALSLSATGYALLALCAIVAARGIAPALPGTTTGIARLISAAVWFAACVSQLIAAGGIVLSVRLLGTLFAIPSLGIAFRFTALGAGLGVVALVAASATRPLEAELATLLALIAWIVPTTILPFLFGRRVLRATALGVAFASAAMALDLVGYELSRRPGAGEGAFAFGCSVLAFLAVFADAASAIFATRALSANWRGARTTIVVASAITLSCLLLARLGESHTAPTALVLAHRVVDALTQHRFAAIPDVIEAAVTIFVLCVAGALLRVRARNDVRAALSLLLLARTCAPAPIAALLSISSALLLARAVIDPHLVPERETSKSMI
jgi:hypothetical protein